LRRRGHGPAGLTFPERVEAGELAGWPAERGEYRLGDRPLLCGILHSILDEADWRPDPGNPGARHHPVLGLAAASVARRA